MQGKQKISLEYFVVSESKEVHAKKYKIGSYQKYTESNRKKFSVNQIWSNVGSKINNDGTRL